MKNRGLLMSCAAAAVLLCANTEAFACSCVYEGGFLQVVSKANAVVEANIVGKGRVEGMNNSYMDVEVVKVLHGTPGGTTLRIWGDNGYQCRRNVEPFRPGTTWVFALNRIREKERGVTDFELSVCGEYVLRRDGAFVEGNISADDRAPAQRMVLAEFNARLNKALSAQ